jgi:integrase
MHASGSSTGSSSQVAGSAVTRRLDHSSMLDGDAGRRAVKPRRKRVRSPHPGVVLIAPDSHHRIRTWRARYADPDSGRLIFERLDPEVLRTGELRRDWAVRKSHSLAKRRSDLAAGAPRATGMTVSQGVELYFADAVQLRPKTVDTYRLATNNFTDWAASQNIESLDEIGQPELMRFRAAMFRLPKRAPARRGRRGSRVPAGESRSVPTINRELRGVGIMLNYLRRLKKLSKLTSSDELFDGLKPYPEPKKQPDFLRVHELKQLFAAAKRHDAERYVETRDEHAGVRPIGGTPRYKPIEPLVAGVLLSGMRSGEATCVTFEKHVDLRVQGDDGFEIGEFVLTPDITKTKFARNVGMGDVSPALKRLVTTLQIAAGGRGLVFSLTQSEADAAMERLRKFGAPARFSWQLLRSTCDTFLTNAPGIYGAASAYQSSKRTGHSVTVAEKSYLGIVRGIPRQARTLEAAMQIEAEVHEIIERLSSGRAACELPRGRQLRA